MAYAVYKTVDPAESQLDWLGGLARRWQALIDRLVGFDERGDLRLSAEDSLEVFRFGLVDYATAVLASHVEYGWANALDEFNEPLDWKGETDQASIKIAATKLRVCIAILVVTGVG